MKEIPYLLTTYTRPPQADARSCDFLIRFSACLTYFLDNQPWMTMMPITCKEAMGMCESFSLYVLIDPHVLRTMDSITRLAMMILRRRRTSMSRISIIVRKVALFFLFSKLYLKYV